MDNKIYILRHGETAWNIEKVFRGQAEVPLNDNGRAQAELAAQYLKDKGIEMVYTSPLERAVETAAAVSGATGLEAVKDDAFSGMNFGKWQGRPHTEIKEEDPEKFLDFHHGDGSLRVPGGETFQEVMDRGMDGLKSIVEEHPGKTVLIVTHRVVCKLLVLGALGAGVGSFWKIKLDTASVCRLDREKDKWVVRKVNENFYLDGTLRESKDDF